MEEKKFTGNEFCKMLAKAQGTATFEKIAVKYEDGKVYFAFDNDSKVAKNDLDFFLARLAVIAEQLNESFFSYNDFIFYSTCDKETTYDFLRSQFNPDFLYFV